MDTWAAMREQFQLADGLTYLNHAAVSPLPRPCRIRVEAYLEELATFGAARYPELPLGVLSRARELGARMLGTRPRQVFVVRSTTQGLAVAATGIPFRGGDNVVLVEREFPANIRPWLPLRRRGVEIRFVPQRDGRVLLDDLAAAVDRRTAALSISFVQFHSGFRVDVAAVADICRRHDALFVLDAIQGLGVLSLDVEAMGVDFLSADSHKWMLGPEGVGLGYASDRALDRIEQSVEGWFSVQRPFDFFDLEQPLRDGAARFEEGAYNFGGISGMVGSLDLLLSIGADALEKRLLELTDHLAEGLATRGWTVLSPRDSDAEKSGILLATKDDTDLDAVERALADRAIFVSVRAGALRVSPHGYNTIADIERLLEALDEVG
jgi:cysteine desulfurase / selenocysteine lyase